MISLSLSASISSICLISVSYTHLIDSITFSDGWGRDISRSTILSDSCPLNEGNSYARALQGSSVMQMCIRDRAGGMVSSASDNLVFPYSAEPGNQNPKYELIELVGGTQILFFASNYMLKPMQERNDPRIPCYFEPGADGVYRGLGNREPAVTDDKDNMLSSVVSSYLFRKDAPELIYSCLLYTSMCQQPEVVKRLISV